ncbi:hypothetical protein NAU58_20160 [Pseudomonas stutzeri]|uniref:Uncharacterized protein n=1 Tax=Stutzerimonas stutzeri TaxID=316 RepID=A0A2N8RW93_STUST|nr:hypothetical protein [Stutzerimonas stutzeri]MCQ4297894.1 hypothetical protein [Stutzerimonas stutzeri]PNF78612.1 hypothetical protein CXK92_21095 [Stutzerimonas stutzeri]
MKNIAVWLFKTATVLGALGWSALGLLGTECLFFLGSEDNQIECFAVAFYVYQLLLLPATVLSLVAFVWLTRRQHNTALLLIIIPFLFVKFHLF